MGWPSQAGMQNPHEMRWHENTMTLATAFIIECQNLRVTFVLTVCLDAVYYMLPMPIESRWDVHAISFHDVDAVRGHGACLGGRTKHSHPR